MVRTSLLIRSLVWLLAWPRTAQATVQATADCEANPHALPNVIATLRAQRRPGTPAEVYVKGQVNAQTHTNIRNSITSAKHNVYNRPDSV